MGGTSADVRRSFKFFSRSCVGDIELTPRHYMLQKSNFLTCVVVASREGHYYYILEYVLYIIYFLGQIVAGTLEPTLVRRRLVKRAPTRFSLRGGAPLVPRDDLLPPLPVRFCRASQREPPVPPGPRPIHYLGGTSVDLHLIRS